MKFVVSTAQYYYTVHGTEVVLYYKVFVVH